MILWWKLIAIELDRSMMKTDRHRTALTCVVGGSHANGCFRWRCFSHVHAIAVCIGDSSGMCHLLLHNETISGSCMFQVLIGPRVGTRLFHMSIFYWHTCRVAVGSHVTSLLDHVSYFYRSMWRDHNTSHVFLLLDHVSRCCTFACRYFIGPRVAPWAIHMSFLIQPHGRMDLYHVFCLYWPTCPVWLLHMSFTGSSMCHILI